jgi:phosphoglycolate phosphatase-like HAD superfamily hydrolase
MPNVRLAILDIDGTLTDTNAVDDECFRQAIAGTLGIPWTAVDWAGSPHITDAGICDWLFAQHLGEPPAEQQLAVVKREFVRLLEDAARTRPERFRPIPGATELLSHLASSGWSVALATGAWDASARVKLKAAGIAPAAVPLISSDDASTRAELVRLAILRATASAGIGFDYVVSAGDGLWDLEAAVAVGVGFVGIGSGPKAARLYQHGAGTVLPDWRDLEAAGTALARATVPRAG